MASSDDESEVVPSYVSNYKFTSGAEDELISFAKLPVEWSKGDTHDVDGKQVHIYLRGKTDNGFCKIYVQVTAWKFDLPKEKPEISVLTAQGNWIKLLKPWTPYHDIIRTVLVTLHGLHFVKWNPQQSQNAFWDYLNKILSMFERRPCVDDLADHVPLITEAIKWDGKLEKSKDVRLSFIVDDANEEQDLGKSKKVDKIEESDSHEGDENEDCDSNKSDYTDSVCAICDNGGHLYIDHDIDEGMVTPRRDHLVFPGPTTASSSSTLPPLSPPWIDLPEDVTANILQRLGAEEILTSADRVCSTWRKVCKDPAMWRVIDLIADVIWMDETSLMCRCAVDRSQGQLVDLSIDNFGDDDLLSYVAHRSSRLRRLTLVNPSLELSPSALAEAVGKLPRLEALHLIDMSPLDAECIKAIGMSCPLLESFIYDEILEDVEEGNRIALAIAETMPNLRYLQLPED